VLIVSILAAAVLLGACSNGKVDDPDRDGSDGTGHARYVDPFIGTANEGNTFPGATTPWGMVSVSPHTALTTSLDVVQGKPMIAAGYVYGEPFIHGFGLTHLSGTGCPDLGAPVVAATVGRIKPEPTGYRSSYGDEQASPGYYAARLTGPQVFAEATAAPRVGALRFGFPPRPGDANVLFDVGTNVSWVRNSGYVRIVSDREIEGWCETGLFCFANTRQKVFFVARSNRPAQRVGTWEGRKISTNEQEAWANAGAFMSFHTEDEGEVEIYVGVSYVSVENARQNLEEEWRERSFDELRTDAANRWEEELSRIHVEGGTKEEKTIFYTALYHCLLQPNILSDVNGDYPLMHHTGVGKATDYTRYTVFSLWDTYRNLHPLLSLVYPDRQQDMLRSLEEITREADEAPRWEIMSNESRVMVGDPALIVLADGYLKGFSFRDAETLYRILRRDAFFATGGSNHREGNEEYWNLGYIPMDKAAWLPLDRINVWGPVSTTLEYCFADWSLGQLAGALGHTEDAEQLSAQAGSWVHFLDRELRLLRPKNRDGSWFEPFDPDALEGSTVIARTGGPGYVEGTAWQYSFFVPHDVRGLAEEMGGEEAFVDKLQELFDTDRFAMWNEPDIAFPYLFTYFSGQTWRTQKAVRGIMRRHFHVKPEGLPGNDDTGTLSAWYVFSAIGFYPDNPVSRRYSLGSPVFDTITVRLHPTVHGGEVFSVRSVQGPGEIYIKSAELNGRPLPDDSITHEEIMAGGELVLEMSAEPEL
jgi:predicted alpha-1,2-mannosidase